MKKVTIITIGDAHAGSTKFRMIQYLPLLKSQGFNVTVITRQQLLENPNILTPTDILINQKCLFKKPILQKLRDHSKRLIFDFDDAIYTRPGKPYSFFTRHRVRRRFRACLQTADVVTVANGVLAEAAQQHSCHVKIVPMSLDMDLWKPQPKPYQDTISIGWAGAPHNLKYVESLDSVLCEILAKYPNARLLVFSGEKPKLTCCYDYHPFVSGEEHLFTPQLDIGLLPLTEDEFTRGKSPIKAIQYIACGVPVVANAFGATKEIVNADNGILVQSEQQWGEALETLITDRERRLQMSMYARSHALERFSVEAGFRALLEVL